MFERRANIAIALIGAVCIGIGLNWWVSVGAFLIYFARLED